MNLKELRKLAKERSVKLKTNARKNEILIALGMEPVATPKRYKHCEEWKPPQKIVVKNLSTLEETTFKSILETDKHFGKFAGSITWRIKNDKTLIKDDVAYTFRKVVEA